MTTQRIAPPNGPLAFRTEAPFQTAGTIICIVAPLIAALGLFLHFYQGVAISKETMWGIVGGSSALLCLGIWARFYTEQVPIPQTQAPPPKVAAPLPNQPVILPPLKLDYVKILREFITENPSVEEARKLIQNPQVLFEASFPQRAWDKLIDYSTIPSRIHDREKYLDIAILLLQRYKNAIVISSVPLYRPLIGVFLDFPAPPKQVLDQLLQMLSENDHHLDLVKRCLEKGASLQFQGTHALEEACGAPQIVAFLIPKSNLDALNKALDKACVAFFPNPQVIQQLIAAGAQATKERFKAICKPLLSKKDPYKFPCLDEREKGLIRPFLTSITSSVVDDCFTEIVRSLEIDVINTLGNQTKIEQREYDNARSNSPKLKSYIEDLRQESAVAAPRNPPLTNP